MQTSDAQPSSRQCRRGTGSRRRPSSSITAALCRLRATTSLGRCLEELSRADILEPIRPGLVGYTLEVAVLPGSSTGKAYAIRSMLSAPIHRVVSGHVGPAVATVIVTLRIIPRPAEAGGITHNRLLLHLEHLHEGGGRTVEVYEPPHPRLGVAIMIANRGFTTLRLIRQLVELPLKRGHRVYGRKRPTLVA